MWNIWYDILMIGFPLKYKDKYIQMQDALGITSYAIGFIKDNYNCNIEKYKIVLDVLSNLIQTIKGINDYKPPKEKVIKAIEIIEEIAKAIINDKERKYDFEKTAALCKFWIRNS